MEKRLSRERDERNSKRVMIQSKVALNCEVFRCPREARALIAAVIDVPAGVSKANAK